MKQILTIFFFFVFTLARAADYYVATTGSNSTGNGSSSNPWATLSFALGRPGVNVTGNTIHLASGYYSESGRLSLNTGVNVTGASQTGTILTLTYANESSSDGCFYLYSSSVTNGNQSISHMTLRGNNLSGGKAIFVRARHNVELHHLTIEDFRWGGIHFRNQVDWMTPPNVYASGCKVHHCNIINCADRQYGNLDPGNLRIDGQENMDIYECYFENIKRPAGHNGNTFNFCNNRNVQMTYCTFKKNDKDGGNWNFFAEIFHSQGGFETAYCEFIGAALWDYSNAYNGVSTRGDYQFSFSFHHNTMTTSTGAQISETGVGHRTGAIHIEKGIMEDVWVYNNHIKGYPFGVLISSSYDYHNTYRRFYILQNIFENIGYTDYAYTWGIGLLLEENGSYDVILENIVIMRNVINGGSGYNFNGIRWVANGMARNTIIQDNIVYQWDQTAINIMKQTGESATFDRYTINGNCLNSNGNNTVTIDPQITLMNGSTITYITGNPGFVSSSDFHLIAGSPCVGAGQGTLPIPISYDFDGNAWKTPPSIGCYEYYASTPPPSLHTYYVKNGGNDNADGLSDATAWATIAKVNSFNFSAGDTVLFRRGHTWRELTSLIPKSGTSASPIIYSAYGTGNKPRILGSKQENSTSDWTNIGTNLWRNTDSNFNNSNGGVGNLIFNGEAIIGWKVYSSSDLTAQGRFYYDLTNQHLTLYSTSNPASYYTNIECALGKDAVRLWNSQDNVIIENLDFRYWGAHGISAGGGNSNITIRDCHFRYIGGGDFDGGSYGNAVQFWASYNNILVERNTFYQIYDAAITPQYSGSAAVTATNFVARLNIIEKAYWSFEWFCSTSTASTVNNVYFENNTCYDAGNSWSNVQRPQDQNEGRHLQLWSYDPDVTLSNFNIRNNIFDKAVVSAIRVGQSLAPRVNFDYNLYNVNVLAYDWNTYTTLADWQAAYNKDAHSLSVDPLFVSVGSDYHLQSTSPAIRAGTNVGYTYDFDRNVFASPPSIGVYEFTGTPPPQPVTPVAEFTANRTTINEGQNVQFTDQSTNIPTSWSWNFGDGGTSTAQNPLYTYSTAGTYTVSLRATNSAGYDDEVKTNFITVNVLTLPPVAAFTATNTTVKQGVSVRFYDQSTNTPTSWSWNFGDGSTSSERNPTHIYNIAGTYTVSLRATNAAGYDDEIKTNYITVYEMETSPVADFTADRVSVVQGQAVQFTDLSLYNPTSWYWDFGDSYTSTEQNPIHIYNNTGIYTVVLSVSNTTGGDTRTRQNYINVTTGGTYQYRCLWIRLRAKGVKLRGDRVMKKVPIP